MWTPPLINAGSSPLARGLPTRQVEAHIERRIIPARAGSTMVGEGSVYDVKDHPRSRGVYRTVAITST